MSKGKQRRPSPKKPSRTSTVATADPRPQTERTVTVLEPHSRAPLHAAGAFTLLWCAALGLLAWQTANPVTLNVAQLANADFVVTATVSPKNPTTVDVEKEWKREANLGSITVEQLQETNAQPGETYLMPLTRHAGDVFQITPAGSAKHKQLLLVYPVSPASLEQLRHWRDEQE
ncbi:MAG: hypothetical protein CMJ48_03820 [Planctomycetaceae bacterium]|nr:hypothetical protein [Planctomycetaceae bacterium]